jgi:hypothetical protein
MGGPPCYEAFFGVFTTKLYKNALVTFGMPVCLSARTIRKLKNRIKLYMILESFGARGSVVG